MRRLTQILALGTAALAVAFLAAACGTGAGSSIKSLLPSKTISAPSVSPGGASPTPAPTAQPSAPSPTVQPTAASPTSQPTVARTTAPASPTLQPAGSPATGTGSSWLWLWILIGVVLVIGLVVLVLVTRYARRRSVAAGDWLARAVDAYAQGSALRDAMVAERRGGLAAGDSGVRWAEIQRRADDFAQALYALREAAPETDDRVRVTDVLVALEAARSAMDAQRAPGGGTAGQAEVVHARLSAFRDSLGKLRPSDRRVG